VRFGTTPTKPGTDYFVILLIKGPDAGPDARRQISPFLRRFQRRRPPRILCAPDRRPRCGSRRRTAISPSEETDP